MKGTLRRTGCLLVAFAVALAASVDRNEAGPGTGKGPSVYRTWRTFTAREGLPDASIRAIRVIDGEVWVGTDAGLARRQSDGWRSWTAADGLPEAPITAIDFDPRTGDLWLGTWGGGLVRFTGGRFDRFTQFNSGLAGELIFDVAVVDGRIWIAGNGGISVFEPMAGKWDLYLEMRAHEAVPAVTDLLEMDGDIYAGTWNGPLLRHDTRRDEWVQVGAAPAAVVGGETAVSLVPGGRSQWWTSRGRLFRRERGGSWPGMQLDRPEPATGFVNCLAARSDREAWLGTSAGLQVLSDRKTDTWVLYGLGAKRSEGLLTVVRAGQVVESRVVAPVLPDDRVRCLAFEGDDVWVGTPRGLVLGTDRTRWTGPEPTDPGETSSATESPAGSAGTDALSPGTGGSGRREVEARVGVLGPFTRPISLPGASSPWPTPPVDRVAVARALARANDRQTRPDQTLVLAENVVTFTKYGWITPQDSFAMLRDRYHVHGLIGLIEPNARMDTAVALRTEVPVVNIATTDPTLDESLNPWIFRCGENDSRWQLRLLDFVFDSLGRERPAVLRTPGAENEARLDRWIRHAGTRDRVPVAKLDCNPDDDDLSEQIETLRRSRADVVLTWADARSTATLVRRLRAAGLTQLVVGSDRIATREFVELVGPDPGPVIALSRCPHIEVAGDVTALDEEVRRRRPGLARKPVLPQSGPSFTAAAHLAVAIEIAGPEPEPEAVRQTLAEMGRPRVAQLRDGVWVVEEFQEVELP